MNQEAIIQKYSGLLAQAQYNAILMETRVEELERENAQLRAELEDKDNTDDDKELDI